MVRRVIPAAILAACTALAGCGSDNAIAAREQTPGEFAPVAANGRPAAPGNFAEAFEADLAGETGTAEMLYRRIVEGNPDHKMALYDLGVIAQGRGEAAVAADLYRRTLAVDGAHPSALYNLAILRTGAGDRREAKALSRRLIRVAPGDSRAHLNYGFLLQDMGDLKGAAVQFTRAVRLEPALVTDRTPAAEGERSRW